MRNNSTNRCLICRMYKPLCICKLCPKLSLRTQIKIFMHYRETNTTTNTVRIFKLCVPESEIYVRGKKLTQAQPSISEEIMQQGNLDFSRKVLFLYPSENAQVLKKSDFAKGTPVTLIVPDGSWRQAAKIGKRESILANIPWVKLPPGPPSQYRLRKEPHSESLCTFEAISRALGIIEGEEVRERLDEVFSIMVERVLWSRGLLPIHQCKSPIPQAAIDASYEAGCRGSLIS